MYTNPREKDSTPPAINHTQVVIEPNSVMAERPPSLAYLAVRNLLNIKPL